MVHASRDYREILREALAERCGSNPRYSLRAFARDLKVSSARLSEVLKSKKGLSRKAALQIAERLGLSSLDTQLFCDLVDSEHARSPIARKLANERVKAAYPDRKALNLQLDAFKVVSDWHHFAILQLMHLKGFRSDSAWIGRKLGVDSRTVSAALQRLERVEMIEKRDGVFKPTEDFVMGPDGIPSEALRKFHRQVMEKGIQALATQPVEHRDFTTLVFPIDSRKLPYARQEIRKFRDKLCDELSSGTELDHVFSLSIQLFSLTATTSGEVK